MEWRPAPGAPQESGGYDESLYRQIEGHVERRGEASALSARQRLIVDYAGLFARDHESIDDAFFERLRGELRDDEILDLTVCVARFLAMGRITRVLRLDHECPIGSR